MATTRTEHRKKAASARPRRHPQRRQRRADRHARPNTYRAAGRNLDATGRIMARSFGRVLASIWDDEDFQALSPTAQRLYMFLLSQPDLEHSGVIPLRSRRWAQSCGALTPGLVAADLAELGAARFVITDEETEEVLVRSLIRRDDVWKQPNVFKAACRHAVRVKSAAIRSALLAELERLDLSSAKDEVRDYRDDAALALAKGSGNPSPTLPPTRREPVAEPPPKASRRPRGKGEGGRGGAGGKQPSAKGSASEPVAVRALWPAAVSVEERDRTALISEIRAAREAIGAPWTAASIERVLSDSFVTRHPGALIRAAALIVARDPESKHIARLAHDGPWWEQAAAQLGSTPTAPKPPWCRKCDERTRKLDWLGDNPKPCPACHPSLRKETA